MEKEKSKQQRCRFSLPDMHLKERKIEYRCVHGSNSDNELVTKEQCENCKNFKSKFIEYPITISEIKYDEVKIKPLCYKCGTLCEIRPCAEEYKNKSFIGFYLGEAPVNHMTSYDEETKVLTSGTLNSPAIFVPELGKIIYGQESWWRPIKSIDDFKGITKEDIENTWYVKLLTDIIGEPNEKKDL